MTLSLATSGAVMRQSHGMKASLSVPKSHNSFHASQFPIASLPELLRRYAEEGAESVSVPVEMVALPLLIAAGATIGRNRALRLKLGFEQLPILFGAVVAPPGAAKSPALSAALRPLRQLQHRAMETQRKALQQMESQQGSETRRTFAPILDHLYSTDATVEAIAPMLCASPGLLVHHDELVAWVRSCDAYRAGKGADRQRWLSIWSGEPIKVDRKTAGSILVARPAVSVIGGVQPDMLHTLHDRDGGRDGFVERILWVNPDVKPAPWTEKTIAETTLAAAIDLFAALRKPTRAGTAIIELDRAARDAWTEWFDGNQSQVFHSAGLEAGFASKLPNQIARLALILHAAGDPRCEQVQLDEHTMRAAIALGEYFRGQFCRVIPLITGTAKAQAQGMKPRIEEILQSRQRLSRTEVYGALNRNVSKSDLDQVLNELASEGKVRKAPVDDTGGRPAEYWQWIEAESFAGGTVIVDEEDEVVF